MAEVPYPSVVSRHLAQGASIGFSQGLVWCLSRTQLTAWDPQGSGAAITRRLPLQADPGLAQVALGATPSGLTALLVTPQGDSVLWDAFTGQQDPFVSRVDGQVSALAAHCTARGGFVAAIGTESGHVHLLRSFPGRAFMQGARVCVWLCAGFASEEGHHHEAHDWLESS